MWMILASSSLLSTGNGRTTLRQLAGPGASRFCSEPSWQSSEVTSSSRIASNGGFVDLGEQLAEVVVERPRPLREEGERRVVAHRADRLRAGGGHRLEDDVELLLGVAERLLALAQRRVRDDLALARGQVVEVDQAGVQPVLVRVLGGQRALDLGVVDDAAGRGVDRNMRPGSSRPFSHHRARRHVQHADLGGQRDQPVLGDPVAGRTQAVAVEHGADHGAVGEADQRGAVPGLHERGVELVEGPACRIHLAVVLPRLRDHHQHRVRQAAPAEVQQLEHLVEGRRVARVRGDDRGEPRQVARDEVRGQQRLAGGHPVAVAAQGVDLAVVRDVAVRVGQRPRRERVRREPGVHQRQSARDPLVREVRVERLELRLGQHALVDQRARRQAREVGPGLVLGALAQAVRAAFQGDARRRGRRRVRRRSAAATNSCRNAGIAARALGPRSALSTSVGTSRQPSTRRFSSAASFSIRATAAAACSSSVGRNAVPTAYSPAGGSAKSTTPRRNASGTWIRMPTPSPVLYSAPRAPRCSSRSSAVRPRRTISWSLAAREVGHQGHTAGVVLVLGGVHTGGRGNRPVARADSRSQEFLLSSRCTPTPASGRRVVWCEVSDAPVVPDQLVRSGEPGLPSPRTGESLRTAVGQSGHLGEDIARPGYGSDRTQRRGRFSRRQASHAVPRKRQRKTSERGDAARPCVSGVPLPPRTRGDHPVRPSRGRAVRITGCRTAGGRGRLGGVAEAGRHG